MARKKKPAAVVGLVGFGKVPIKAAKEHLSEFIEAQDGDILWVFADTDNVTKSMAKIKDMLWDEEEVTYALVSDGTSDDPDWEEYAKTTVTVEEGQDPYAALVTEVAGYEADRLAIIFILDEEHEGDVELLEAAASEGLKCYDLTAGLQELEFEEVEDADADEETEDDEEEEEVVEAEEVEETSPSSLLDAIPAKVEKLINAGKHEEAGAALAKELGSDGVKELAEELGLEEAPKGTWAKTIGKSISEHLGGAVGGDDDQEAVEEEEVAEEDVAEEDPSVPEPTSKRATEFTTGHSLVSDDLRWVSELIAAASYVAGQKGSVEAEKFVKMVKKELLR